MGRLAHETGRAHAVVAEPRELADQPVDGVAVLGEDDHARVRIARELVTNDPDRGRDLGMFEREAVEPTAHLLYVRVAEKRPGGRVQRFPSAGT